MGQLGIGIASDHNPTPRLVLGQMRPCRASERFFALAMILATVTIATTCGDSTGPEEAGPAAATQLVAGDQ